MKQIKNMLTVVTVCAALATNAKQIGSKTNTNAPKPTPQPTPYVQPKPTPMPQPAPYYSQPQSGPTYTEIYDSLRKKTPDSSDISTLNNIILVAQKQIDQIQASVERKPTPINKSAINTNTTVNQNIALMRSYAGNLVNKYQISLDRTQQQILNSYINDTDLFSDQEQDQHYRQITKIMGDFVHEYPNADQNSTVNFIYLAITQHKNFIKLQDEINSTLGQNGPEMIEEIGKDLKNIISYKYTQLKNI